MIVAAGAPAEVITAEIVATCSGSSVVVIDDPVSHTPLVVPVGSRHAAPHLAPRQSSAFEPNV